MPCLLVSRHQLGPDRRSAESYFPSLKKDQGETLQLWSPRAAIMLTECFVRWHLFHKVVSLVQRRSRLPSIGDADQQLSIRLQTDDRANVSPCLRCISAKPTTDTASLSTISYYPSYRYNTTTPTDFSNRSKPSASRSEERVRTLARISPPSAM